MAKIYENLVVSLDRAEVLAKELLSEYQKSLGLQSVTPVAIERTHDVSEKLRGVLDRTARRYWELHIAPQLSEADKKAATVYFPVAPDEPGMGAVLGRWRWQGVRPAHQPVYDYLLAQQPFRAARNRWLGVLADLAIHGKHIDLIPQKRSVDRHVTVSRGDNSVTWTSGVVFSGNVSVMGAPINPATQRIFPTPGVTEQIQDWVSFTIAGHNVNAAGFCEEACRETRRIVQEMTDLFSLS